MSAKAEKIIQTYVPGTTSLRSVALLCGVDHHQVKRVLLKAGMTITKGKRKPFTVEHCKKISERSKGRKSHWAGKKMPKRMVYQNMHAHIRYDVTLEWLEQFEDLERLKYLNSCLRWSDRFPKNSSWYVKFIETFYNEDSFLRIYRKWLANSKCRWLRPTIDHKTPKSKGGTNSIENLQFLPWFENRAKCDMTVEEWQKVKDNFLFYLT